jgi:DNA-directed RNA polymerase subunit RPC12/RpoP
VQTIFIFFAVGGVGKLIYKNTEIKCLRCGKTSKGDVLFCPKCGNRIGWNNKQSKVVKRSNRE